MNELDATNDCVDDWKRGIDWAKEWLVDWDEAMDLICAFLEHGMMEMKTEKRSDDVMVARFRERNVGP